MQSFNWIARLLIWLIISILTKQCELTYKNISSNNRRERRMYNHMENIIFGHLRKLGQCFQVQRFNSLELWGFMSKSTFFLIWLIYTRLVFKMNHLIVIFMLIFIQNQLVVELNIFIQYISMRNEYQNFKYIQLFMCVLWM